MGKSNVTAAPVISAGNSGQLGGLLRASSFLRRVVAAAAAVTVFLAVAGPPASAAPPTRDNNCIHPSGVSLNELFGVPEQFVSFICEDLRVGQHWRPIMSYFGAYASDAVYPEGYVPLYANPVDDVLAKIEVKVVIDGGTSQQKTYRFFPTDEDTFRTDLWVHDLNPDFPDIPSFFIMPRMAPLSRGHHTYEFIWVQYAPHCDGISVDEGTSCLPAGEFSVFVDPADVLIPHFTR